MCNVHVVEQLQGLIQQNETWWGSHRSVAEHLCLVGCYTMLTGKSLQTFWKHYRTLKHLHVQLFTSWHNITFQKTWIFKVRLHTEYFQMMKTVMYICHLLANPPASEVCTNKGTFKEWAGTSHSVKQLVAKWMACI